MISLRNTTSEDPWQDLRLPPRGSALLHSPYFSSPTAKLRRMLGEDVAFDNLDC